MTSDAARHAAPVPLGTGFTRPTVEAGGSGSRARSSGRSESGAPVSERRVWAENAVCGEQFVGGPGRRSSERRLERRHADRGDFGDTAVPIEAEETTPEVRDRRRRVLAFGDEECCR